MEHKLSQIEASVAVDQRRNMIEDQLSQIEASVSALNLAGLNMNELTQAVSRAVVPPPPAAERGRQYHAFSVYCNSCDQTIPGAHFHCSTCDDGDFDLCQTCVDKNVTCYGEDHWLIKRTMKNNVIINSFTERLAPRPKATPEVPPVACPAPIEETSASKSRSVSLDDHYSVPSEVVEVEHRTCNSCVQGLLFARPRCGVITLTAWHRLSRSRVRALCLL